MQPSSTENLESEIIQNCEIAFGPNSTNEQRRTSSIWLQEIGENEPRFLQVIEKVLKLTQQPEVLIFFSNIGLKIVKKFWGTLDTDFLLNFQGFLVEFIKARNFDSPSVIKCIARLPCHITKLGWNQDNRFKNITSPIVDFMSGDSETCNKGLVFLSVLIEEIDKGKKKIITAKHRKIAAEFRDKDLLEIFALAVDVLNRSLTTPNFAQQTFIDNALSLMLKCLNFDFIGSNTDESSSEFGTLQIPAKWLDTLNPKANSSKNHPVAVVWEIVMRLSATPGRESDISNCICKSLQLLESFALTRRSIFPTENEKKRYFSLICMGSITVLNKHSAILNNLDVFNSFCRLLISLQNNVQINILVRLDCYQSWIDSIAKFTTTAFKMHGASSNGVHYLLQLWSKFSSSIAFFQGKMPNFLKKFIPVITLDFLQSNLNHLCGQLQENEPDLEDLLSEVEMNSIQRFLPSLFLFDYERSLEWVQSKFEAHIGHMKNISSGRTVPTAEENRQLRKVEVEMAWVVYVVAAVISGNVPIGVAKEKFKALDAQLCALVLQVLPFSAFRAELQFKSGVEATSLLERAVLYFFTCFQQSYIQLYISRPVPTHQDKFFSILSNVLNKKVTQQVLMDTIMERLLGNFLHWYKNEQIVTNSLNNLLQICSGYDSYRTACKSEIIKSVLENHFAQFNGFLEYLPNLKARTVFFQVFTRFTFGSKASNVSLESSLSSLLQPFDKNLSWLATQSGSSTPDLLVKISGVFRDLRGICTACTKKEQYNVFFEWFQNRHLSTFLLLFELHSNKPNVAIPMLRFLEDLVHNKSARISYDFTSVEGLILFDSAQKALSIYCMRLSQIPLDLNRNEENYQIKIKGITVSMAVLTRMLAGSYIPFGAFEFYKDNSFRDIVNNILKIVLSVPLELLYSYQKMAGNYYELVDIIFLHHIDLVGNFPSEVLATILKSLSDGIQSTVVSHSTKAASALDNMFAFIVTSRRKSKKTESFNRLQKHLEGQTDLLLNLVTVLFQFVVFDSLSNHFTLTRCLHALLAFNPAMLEFYVNVLISGQLPENQERLKELLRPMAVPVRSGIMTGSTRDDFSRAIISLRLYATRVSIIPVCR